MDFRTNDGVMEIFRNLNCNGNSNCIFVTFKDTSIQGVKYGLAGGAVGAGLGGVIGGAMAATSSFANGVLEGLEGSDGLLINWTENGLGVVPLVSNGLQLTLNMDKMEPRPEGFVFIKNEDIESIIVKNFSFINKKSQKVKIKLNSGKTFHLMARLTEKNIPYHEGNFTKFMSTYKKK